MALRRFTLIMYVIAAPSVLHAQATAEWNRVRIGRYDDGFSSGVYAYVRGEEGIISSVDDDGIIFSVREPILVWVCQGGELVTVYRYDTDFIGEDNLVSVRYKFDDKAASKEAGWPMEAASLSEEDLELFMAVTGTDTVNLSNNPMVNLMMGSASAVRVPQEVQEDFLAAASNANVVMLRVTDVDGETYTDRFSLTGLSEALAELRRTCP